ncbi:MAG: dTDP-glucose 4,6-dehydratase [Hyphomicrobium sp.]|nr:MAG: dTDP-glucose 4,6-dehydratase [Hyphomicrobium sp.]
MNGDATTDRLSAEEIDDVGSNASQNATMGDIIAERLSRRELMSGLLAVSAISAVAAPISMLTACSQPASATPSFNFTEVAAGSDGRHHVADGYNADVLIRWGDKVLSNAPEFDVGAQTGERQATQFGYNNDFLHFIPLDGRSDHGLLVVNHEYTNSELMFPGIDPTAGPGKSYEAATRNRVDVEMMAHGGTVIEVKRDKGKWGVVPNSVFARRLTAETEMLISGPAAGHERMRTSDDASGMRVRGMINNCGGAVTPWGTWLSCEENFNLYFHGKGALDTAPGAAALKRYGVPSERYPWAKFHDRFNIAKEPNEPNRFGWVVEIDPLDPTSVPVKRTALGRFKHEGAGNVINGDGRFVVYQGDDQRFDYVYRFVTKGVVDTRNRAANKDLLDQGTLYVARFDADGTGVWLPLEHGQGPLTAAAGFKDQGDVVIFARLAADLVGATKMDRPEDIDVNPRTNKVYLMLTSNSDRSSASVDAANPRPANTFGHIIEITPDGNDHAAPRFSWEILLKCGDPAVAAVGATFNPLTTKNGWFANPDNCVIDGGGRLWVATDGNSKEATGRTDGIWGVETKGSARGTSKLFFQCPAGAEMCGPAFTPDDQTFFVAVQHPAQSPSREQVSTFDKPLHRWPETDPQSKMPPRPAIVAITRKGGGKIAV